MMPRGKASLVGNVRADPYEKDLLEKTSDHVRVAS